MTNCGKISPIEILLARLLSYGTWISTSIILIGLTMAFTVRPSTATGAGRAMHVVSGGIALLILLPVLRVIFMLVAFVRKHDYRFAAFAGIVLIILILGFALGAKEQAGLKKSAAADSTPAAKPTSDPPGWHGARAQSSRSSRQS
jgi:uncharacterized membrane protein